MMTWPYQTMLLFLYTSEQGSWKAAAPETGEDRVRKARMVQAEAIKSPIQ